MLDGQPAPRVLDLNCDSVDDVSDDWDLDGEYKNEDRRMMRSLISESSPHLLVHSGIASALAILSEYFDYLRPALFRIF